jgi:hypothetical protein
MAYTDAQLYEQFVWDGLDAEEVTLIPAEDLAYEIADQREGETDNELYGVSSFDIALAVHRHATCLLHSKALERVDSEQVLGEFAHILLGVERPEMAEHLTWVANAPTDELIQWARTEGLFEEEV